jgi:hypothetical protein
MFGSVVADTPYLRDRLNQVLLGALARRDATPRLLVALWNLAGAAELAPAVARIAREGAARGVHLLVADNRYVPIPIDPYLTLRASMRSISERESLDIVGVPDAYRLGLVGEALLRAGDAAPVWLRPEASYEPIELEAAGAPPLWTPPPGAPPIPAAGPEGGRRVRLGIVDRPFEHRRDPLICPSTRTACASTRGTRPVPRWPSARTSRSAAASWSARAARPGRTRPC